MKYLRGAASLEIDRSRGGSDGHLAGIGRRTALRLVLNMLAKTKGGPAEAMVAMKEDVKPATSVTIRQRTTRATFANPHRDASTVCVVEDVRDLLALESMGEYRGLYHVLGGVIGPMDGVGPADLNVDSLVSRAQTEEVNEVILALPASMEGDTAAFYLAKRLKETSTLLTALARGVAVGEALQYADEATLEFVVEPPSIPRVTDLSVIIVSYNVRAFLEQCLVSFSGRVKALPWTCGWWTITAWTALWKWSISIPRGSPHCQRRECRVSKANNGPSVSLKGVMFSCSIPTRWFGRTPSESAWRMPRRPQLGGMGVPMYDGTGKYLPESKRGLPTPWAAFVE